MDFEFNRFITKQSYIDNVFMLKSSYQIRPDSDGGGIQVSLKKMKPDWWPRLMYQQQKLSWLKVVDISRFEDMH